MLNAWPHYTQAVLAMVPYAGTETNPLYDTSYDSAALDGGDLRDFWETNAAAIGHLHAAAGKPLCDFARSWYDSDRHFLALISACRGRTRICCGRGNRPIFCSSTPASGRVTATMPELQNPWRRFAESQATSASIRF